MHAQKYSSYIVALLFLYGCGKHAYKRQEEKGYYTQNSYKSDSIQPFEKTITILESPNEISKFRKKLVDRMPKWSITGTEKKPYELWINFFNKEILESLLKKLAQKHDTTLLENFFDEFGILFKEPTPSIEKKVIAALKKLKADTRLVEAFQKCIAERYHQPETIYLDKSRLAYEEFFYFIFESNKNNTRHIKLKKLQAYLTKWQEDGHPNGTELWKKIQEEEKTSLQSSKIYRYQENQQAIAQSLCLMHQLMRDPYTLTYKDLLETLPHGKNKLEAILDELLERRENKNIKSLRTYLNLISDCL